MHCAGTNIVKIICFLHTKIKITWIKKIALGYSGVASGSNEKPMNQRSSFTENGPSLKLYVTSDIGNGQHWQYGPFVTHIADIKP